MEDASNQYTHIVGNGSSATARKDVYALDWSVNAEYAGDVVAYGCGSEETTISLMNINYLVQSLQAEIGNINEITSEDIQSLFV